MDGVLGIAVAEVVLDQAQVVALVGEVVAAGVPERVRVDARQTGAPGGEADKVADGLPGKRLAAFRQEQPGRDCREFRVWGRTMPLKEPSYVAPQTAYDPG